ncbi:unnamed protein product [Gongylonema pulchrum]|uniref:Uncharacterized protein n=1 Tax=Gongylonema pulchrum TaxID=637853 RepID=A0A183CZ13_9BILA|nr:unnamed protein product [Gongylonema pulchrum]
MIVDRFWAELFRLSVDRTQWDILHPSLLSITVLEVPSRKSGTNGKAIQFIAKSETRIVSEQILETCKTWNHLFLAYKWHQREPLLPEP